MPAAAGLGTGAVVAKAPSCPSSTQKAVGGPGRTPGSPPRTPLPTSPSASPPPAAWPVSKPLQNFTETQKLRVWEAGQGQLGFRASGCAAFQMGRGFSHRVDRVLGGMWLPCWHLNVFQILYER